MEPSVLAARLLLASVFAVAAVAKLRDRDRLQGTLFEFGLPGPLVRAGSWTLPLIELAVAALLVPATTARVGAFGGLALLVVFSTAVARTLALGKRPDCNCFGAAHSAPIGWRTLIRNGALAALGVLVATRPAPGPDWIDLTAAGGAALVAAQAWLWLELLRRYGRALRRIGELESAAETPEPLAAGSPAPPFALADLDGRIVTLPNVLEEAGEAILLFTSPGCPACEHALDEARGRGLPFVTISAGDPDEVAATAARYDLDTVLLDRHSEVAQLYRVAAVPSAVRVDARGRVVHGAAVGTAEVAELVRSATSLRLAGEAA